MPRTPDHDPRWARPLVQRFRALCLSLPDTTEAMSWGHPNFQAQGKTFVTFEVVKERPSMAFRLDPKDIAAVRIRDDAFETPYGRGKWISLWADGRVNWRLIGQLVRRSHKAVTAPMKAASGRRSRAGAPSGRPRGAARR